MKMKQHSTSGFYMCASFVSTCTRMVMMFPAFFIRCQKTQEFVPYIFTKGELAQFFAAVDAVEATPVSPLRHLVLPVLFRLIYTCGLRVSEALRLKAADVDLERGIMTVYGAKGDKDRMVGISDSMLEYMRNYRLNPAVAGFDSEYFFPAPDGGFYDTSTIYAYFREYLFAAGIPHRGRGKDRVYMTFVIPLRFMYSTNGAAKVRIFIHACQSCVFSLDIAD